ncbi:unnamed protein product [Amoebophrya sp. A25]|nr:unnamed protein product [Amoebophrya sp. A25]|eukprot:GSA25T00017470001.1
MRYPATYPYRSGVSFRPRSGRSAPQKCGGPVELLSIDVRFRGTRGLGTGGGLALSAARRDRAASSLVQLALGRNQTGCLFARTSQDQQFACRFAQKCASFTTTSAGASSSASAPPAEPRRTHDDAKNDAAGITANSQSASVPRSTRNAASHRDLPLGMTSGVQYGYKTEGAKSSSSASSNGSPPTASNLGGTLCSSISSGSTTVSTLAGAAAPASSACTTSSQLVSVPSLNTAVGAWLLGTAGMLFGMIVIGGYTRLSGSGLSMTKWEFQGTLLPANEELWQQEFTAYKETPEYKKLHAGTMDLDGFKRIYFVEWFHRMWGRGLGLVFGLPLLYLGAYRRALTPMLGARLGGLLVLGASQAFIGWWMVRSGFVDPKEHMPHSDNKVPRVSAYRLATHLAAALTIYGGVLYTGLRVLQTPSLLAGKPSAGSGGLDTVAKAFSRHAALRKLALMQAAIVSTTIISGAFVAGNDAGLDYNTWPKMLDDWVPDKVTSGYAKAVSDPRILFEDTACVQFNHRMLAYFSAGSALALSVTARKWRALVSPQALFWAGYALPVAVFGQIGLGITTLLHCVPAHLGVLHQAGGVTVLSALLALIASLG